MRDDERGQASPEWLGLILLVSLAFAGMAAAGVSIPGTAVARALAEKLVCAAGLGEGCGRAQSDLVLAYGPELASMVTAHTPQLDYEEGMRAVPVDFRSCRDDACAEGADSGPVSASLAGEPVTLFSHVIDCRDPEVAEAEGYDCSRERAGHVYLQFWAYYPGSQTSRALLGAKGFHPDDWESFSIRIGAVTEARASSHHGYNGAGADPVNDTGILGGKSAWVESSGHYLISGGSHAGRVGGPERTPVRGPPWLSRGPWRWTRSGDVRIVPIESIRDGWGDYTFEVTPPWAKEVFRDPEWRGT